MNQQTNYLAIANVLWQVFNKTYDPETALKEGTIFPELNLPFEGKKMKNSNIKFEMKGIEKWEK